jgi:biotin carboxylase
MILSLLRFLTELGDFMADSTCPTVLCVSSYFKGNRFLRRCKKEGCHVILVTVEERRHAGWERESIDEFFVMPSLADRRAVINGLAYLMRTRDVSCLVALDDYDVELAAFLREHFRIQGMGESTMRYFRDKLGMRTKAREAGIDIPDFVGIINHDDVREFLARVPAPWLLKPRLEASSIGIQKCTTADEVWRRIEELGDDQSFYLIEKMIEGDLELFHVDSLVSERQVVFAEVGKYHRPLLEVYQGGGIFATKTVPRDVADARTLRRLNEKVLDAFGMVRGCSHTEFIRGRSDGPFYFIETSARVGGANISEMTEAATGLNLWEEWAKIEIATGRVYRPQPLRQEYGGVTISLARQETPDTSSFDDPEIFFRLDHKHHIGLVVRATTPERVEVLLTKFMDRIAREYQAVLPPATKATA